MVEPGAGISLRGIVGEYRTKAGPVRAIDGVDLDIAPGEAVCIMGRSGSGKTTLLDIIGTLLKPAAGQYLFAGRDLAQLAPKALAEHRNSRVGFVFQSFNLLDELDVRRNVMLPLAYGAGRRRTSPEDAARTEALLERLGLAELASRSPAQLSGGQRQRVAIARALIRNPSLLLADEPTGSLDTRTAREVLRLLRDTMDARRSLVLVTHDTGIARLFERVLELQDGRVVGGAT